MPRETDAARGRLERFILESIKLDALLDARARDIEFIKSGGEVFYSPDQSIWSAFFFPIKNGQEGQGSRGGSVDGFAEVYQESDRMNQPFIPNSPLTGKQVTGMLGKVLIDAIFAPQNTNDVSPEFFLTEESKEGLNQAIEILLIAKSKGSRNTQLQRNLATAFQKLKKEFAESGDEEMSAELFLGSPHALDKSGTLEALLDDDNPINLVERSKLYNRIAFFDWSYIESQVEAGRSDEETFHFGRADLRKFDELRAHFSRIFRNGLPKTDERKIASMSEVLALNRIMQKSGNGSVRFAYLTMAKWAIRDFDRFVWNEDSDQPLKPARKSNRSNSVSSLFVRSPLCFLHDIELRPEDGETRSSLKVLMDTIVPRKLHDERRLDTSDSKRSLIKRALQDLEDENKIELYSVELDKFYQRWSKKKVPWVNTFLEQKGDHWGEGLELFSKEGFHSFWRKINRDFSRESWQFGIYLGLMTEECAARAAPLVFIDCDMATNQMLSAMQSELTHGDIGSFQEQFDGFIARLRDGQSEERSEYFDSLVNAVLFMFSNQFETTRSNAEIACDLAEKSKDPDITGREAYYLRSHLGRVMAKDRTEIEVAHKLMLIARSKLESDNASLSDEKKISAIRFDLEDWSRKIVVALANYFDSKVKRKFPIVLLSEYLSFVREHTSNDFADIKEDERNALFERICERIRFNFLVLAVTIDESHGRELQATGKFLENVVGEWNRSVAINHATLAIRIDDSKLELASTIEAAYLVALAAGAPHAEFVQNDLDIDALVSGFFGEENRGSIKSAKTSFVDNARYNRLRKYCMARANDLEVHG